MNKFIQDYYKNSGIVKILKKGQVLKNEELYQLYKKPLKDQGKAIPSTNHVEPLAVCQADLLYLPEDDGYKYCLVMCDIGSGLNDAVPLKERDAETVLKAFKTIRARKPL